MEKLKPCPFCGGDPKTRVDYLYNVCELILRFSVECNCGVKRTLTKKVCSDSFDKYIKIMDETIELWNRRA